MTLRCYRAIKLHLLVSARLCPRAQAFLWSLCHDQPCLKSCHWLPINGPTLQSHHVHHFLSFSSLKVSGWFPKTFQELFLHLLAHCSLKVYRWMPKNNEDVLKKGLTYLTPFLSTYYPPVNSHGWLENPIFSRRCD